MTDMTMFDHRASIVAFLTAKVVALDVDREAAEVVFEETDCHETMEEIKHLSRQAGLVRAIAAQIACGDDLPAVSALTSVAVASTTSPLPPLLAVGPMQNRGAQ